MTEVGAIYGKALYDLALADGVTGSILEELSVLNKSFQTEPEFLRLLSTPNLSKQERCQIIDDSFRNKIHPYVLNFLKILTEKGYMRHFSHCCEAYREQYNQDNGIVAVCAVTAVALTDDQSRRLCGKLSRLTGKRIELTNRIDPACLGGVRLDFDGKRLDDTVSHRLETVAGLLKNTVI